MEEVLLEVLAAVGLIRSEEMVPMESFYIHNNLDKGEYLEYPSVEEFFAKNPNFDPEDCEINDQGVFLEDFNICMPMRGKGFTTQESELRCLVKDRCSRKASIKVAKRGVSCYRKLG